MLARLVPTLATFAALSCSFAAESTWTIDDQAAWEQAQASQSGIAISDGVATPTKSTATFTSIVHTFPEPRQAQSLTIKQVDTWLNWNPTGNLGPANLSDAPVMLTRGPDDYWMFGRYGGGKSKRKKKGEAEQSAVTPNEPATLEGFDIPLTTTKWPNQFDAPGGLKEGLGGYHAWQSRDMVNWVHHGPVTEKFSRWVTTAEMVDGKAYIYYDYPNDQDPHVYVDDNLTDGIPGDNKGMAFLDPSHGSDCAFIRDLEGTFHVIYEDWSPINAQKNAWDSPLAGRAISKDGLSNFEIVAPAVDERTTPTGQMATHTHPHWLGHPDWDTNIAEYEIHEPAQDAFGDWAAIAIGGQYYLFGDYDHAHVPGEKRAPMSVAWFTSSSIDKQFTFCGDIGNGHPDPDVAFAEGQFYLATQQNTDFISPGPWVEQVEVRAGVDTTNDGAIDQWGDWGTVSEQYDYIEGFSKQVAREAAILDCSSLPAGHGFGFELRITETTSNGVKPELDQITFTFK